MAANPPYLACQTYGWLVGVAYTTVEPPAFDSPYIQLPE